MGHVSSFVGNCRHLGHPLARRTKDIFLMDGLHSVHRLEVAKNSRDQLRNCRVDMSRTLN